MIPINILYPILRIAHEGAAYNEYPFPLRQKHNVVVCTFFSTKIPVPDEITIFDGNNTVGGFFQALTKAFKHREYDVIHIHDPHIVSAFSLFTLKNDIKAFNYTINTIHNSYPNFKPRNRLLLLPSFAFFKRVVVCGNAALASWPRFYKRMAGERMIAIPNGVNIERVDTVLNQSTPKKPAEFTIVALGRAVRIKNLGAAVEAFAKSSSFGSRLVIIGEGELLPALERKIAQTGLGNQIELTGSISREEVYRRFADADLFISTSLGEGLPIAVLEAMACGCPVILSDIPPHREISETADFIPLVPPDDPERLSREIERFRLMAPSERKRIGDMCRSLVEERFSLSKMLNEYHQVYCEIINMNSSRDRAKHH